MRLLPMLLLALGLGAECSDNGINPIIPDDNVELVPEIRIQPQVIEFGDARLGDTLSETIYISNEGTDVLEIGEVRLEGGQAFNMPAVEPRDLLPGEEMTVQVTFSPVTVDHEARVVVTSNDPVSTNSVVSLDGYGLIPQLYAWPTPYDFGVVEPECTREGFVTLENVGRETLNVDGIAQIGGDFVLDESNIELPLQIEPGESFDVRLEFTPPEVANFEGELWITSDGGDAVVQETGEGGAALPYTDEWSQPVSNVADIFFWVDQSCSMEDDQQLMIENFATFIDELQEIEADYQIFVTTRASGCTNIPPITPLTSYEQARSQIQYGVTVPHDGQFSEAGLMIMSTGMSESALSGCNAALMRDNAILSWIMVSDEPEQSPPQHTWDQAVPNLLQIAPGSYIHSVVGPVPDGCETAEPGSGYAEATAATGGMSRSICNTNWGEHLTEIAELATVAQLADTFYLSNDPQPETIQVFVDGEEVTEGWRYSEEGNSIIFEPDEIPGEGADISALYFTGFTCD